MDALINPVKQVVTQHASQTIWIAYSGGRDSHALLHVCATLKPFFPSLKWVAVHIHHGLSPHADAWGDHCKTVCQTLTMDFLLKKVTLKKEKGLSVEEQARIARYRIFKMLLQPNDLLLTAHHQEDQAETVLLQLMRGSGPKGLSAMPDLKSLSVGWHARPWLAVPREMITAYALKTQTPWIEDESNDSLQFTRNFIRRDVMPVLNKRFPAVANTLARVALHCAEAENVIQEVMQQELVLAKGSVPGALSVQYLKQLTMARKRLVLRAWLSAANVRLPSTVMMKEIVESVLTASADRFPRLTWDQCELRRYRDDLIIHQNSHFVQGSADQWTWDGRMPLVIDGVGTLRLVATKGQGLKKSALPMTVRFRQGGERCRLPGRSFHHSLKKLFQVWQVPTWIRDSVPLIYIGETLAAVVGYTVCEGFAAGPDEESYVVTCSAL